MIEHLELQSDEKFNLLGRYCPSEFESSIDPIERHKLYEKRYNDVKTELERLILELTQKLSEVDRYQPSGKVKEMEKKVEKLTEEIETKITEINQYLQQNSSLLFSSSPSSGAISVSSVSSSVILLTPNPFSISTTLTPLSSLDSSPPPPPRPPTNGEDSKLESARSVSARAVFARAPRQSSLFCSWLSLFSRCCRRSEEETPLMRSAQPASCCFIFSWGQPTAMPSASNPSINSSNESDVDFFF